MTLTKDLEIIHLETLTPTREWCSVALQKHDKVFCLSPQSQNPPPLGYLETVGYLPHPATSRRDHSHVLHPIDQILYDLQQIL